MTPNVMICRGNIVYSKDRNELAAHSDSYIAVEDGRVEGIYERLPEKFEGTPVKDFGDNVIIPAFSDLHVHAPQFPQRGLGMDLLPGIYTQVGRSVQLSKLKAFYEPEGNRAIPFANAFYMATKEGGALFGKVGSLEPGYEFDALVIRDFSDSFRKITPEETVERFCYTGNPRDILAGFIQGEQVTGKPTENSRSKG